MDDLAPGRKSAAAGTMPVPLALRRRLGGSFALAIPDIDRPPKHERTSDSVQRCEPQQVSESRYAVLDEPVPPATLFDERLLLDLDRLEVRLIHVEPCHRIGDTIVHVPAEGVDSRAT